MSSRADAQTHSVALVLLAVAAMAAPAEAQRPGPILDRAIAAFQRITTMRADFTMSVNDPMLGTNESSSGEFFHQRPNKIALKWRRPAGDVILSDGQTLWVYLPSSTPNQVIRTDLTHGGQQSPDFLAEFLNRPRDRFAIQYLRADSVGRREADVLAFTPKEQNTAYRRVLVWIDRQDSLPHQFELSEASGAVRRYVLDNLRVNRTLPSSAFVFTPPTGARVVDATQQ